MHYKNGREAKNGDKVMWIPDPKYGASPCVGILYNATAGQDYCNGQLALVVPGNPTPNLKECLHLEDAFAALESGQILKGQVDAALDKQIARSEAERASAGAK
jgi:hypothetical protein